MQMTNGEICASYRDAKDKREQVTILAELNACSVDSILDILKEGGYDGRQLPRKKNKSKAAHDAEKAEGNAQEAEPTQAEAPQESKMQGDTVLHLTGAEAEAVFEAVIYESERVSEKGRVLNGLLCKMNREFFGGGKYGRM